MIMSPRFNFVFLCMPKCASTSSERILRRFGQITTSSDPQFKHLPFRAYERYLKPLLLNRYKNEPKRIEDIEVICLFREPVDWVNSWYRYRTRPALLETPGGKARSTANITFDEFARAYVSNSPKAFAGVGRQINFVKDKDGRIGNIKFFRYEEYNSFITYMSAKVGKELVAPHLNVSPLAERRKVNRPAFLVEYLREEYNLYEKI